jgi:protein-disulfide isomerase
LEPIEQLTRQAVDQFGVKGTPTFFINSKMHVGELTFERISAAIDTELMQ